MMSAFVNDVVNDVCLRFVRLGNQPASYLAKTEAEIVSNVCHYYAIGTASWTSISQPFTQAKCGWPFNSFLAAAMLSAFNME